MSRVRYLKTKLLLCLFYFGLSSGCANDESPSVAAKNQETAVGLRPAEMIVHDPVMIEQDGRYFLFTTGPGVSVWSSSDREVWDREAPVFATAPAWAKKEVSGFNGHIWAPDISYHDGLYYLYYSISSFGKNDSCIGLATTPTLRSGDPEYLWTDRGIVVRSLPGIDDWNAIDPNLVEDEAGDAYLSFGSFWSGLKIAKLNEARDALEWAPEAFVTIASQREIASEAGEHAPLEAGSDDIEGPFIVFREGFYYLYASTGYCCRGPESTYRMVVGRSRSVLGPYLDKAGIDMAKGGGTLLLAGDEHWNGVGHNAVCRFEGGDYLVFHAYDASTRFGLPKLRIEPLDYDADGWPVLAELLR